MSERPVHIQIAALAMVVSAALGVWLEFEESRPVTSSW